MREDNFSERWPGSSAVLSHRPERALSGFDWVGWSRETLHYVTRSSPRRPGADASGTKTHAALFLSAANPPPGGSSLAPPGFRFLLRPTGGGAIPIAGGFLKIKSGSRIS